MNGQRNKDIVCRRCGKCCHIDMVAYVTPADIQRWERQQRHDIINRLYGNDIIWAGDRIINKSGGKVTNCYYLSWRGSSFFCQIYKIRPLVCRNFIPGSNELCPQYHRKTSDQGRS